MKLSSADVKLPKPQFSHRDHICIFAQQSIFDSWLDMESTDEIRSLPATIDKSTFTGNEAARLTALSEARALVNRLQKPHELVETLTWTHPFTILSIKILADAGVLQKLSSHPKTCRQLGAETGVDPLLIRRLLRMLASVGIVHGTDADTYVDGEHSAGLKDITGILSGVYQFWPMGADQLAKLPGYFRDAGYQNPTDIQRAPFKSFSNGQGFWEYLEQHPTEHAHFNSSMSSMRKGQDTWLVHYPVQRLLDGFQSSDVLCVDVGGGKGHDLANLRRGLPTEHAHATLVLQDLPAVIEEAEREEKASDMDFMSHDFFCEQPVEAARAYFMHSICHDWPDEESAQILSRLRKAMKPGYSKLLLFETVMPVRIKDITPRMAALDLNMMSHFSALERTEEEWKTLLSGVGLRWNGFFARASAHQGIIEAEAV